MASVKLRTLTLLPKQALTIIAAWRLRFTGRANVVIPLLLALPFLQACHRLAIKASTGLAYWLHRRATVASLLHQWKNQKAPAISGKPVVSAMIGAGTLMLIAGGTDFWDPLMITSFLVSVTIYAYQLAAVQLKNSMGNLIKIGA